MAAFDKAFYAARGYAVVRQALAPGRLRTLSDELDRLQAGCAQLDPLDLVFEKDLPAAGRQGVAADAVGDALFIAGDLCKLSPAFEALLHLPAALDAACAALKAPGLVAHFMNATLKHPRFGRAIAWHRDFPNTYLCSEDASFVRLMFCLDGMTPDNGATRFLPGSHAVSDAHAREEKHSGFKHAHDALAGDMVVIHPKVVHGGPMNRGHRPRRNIVLQVGIAARTLVGERESITGRPLVRTR